MNIDLILIGDGMSGKTSILKKYADLVLQQFTSKYEQYLTERGAPSFTRWKQEQEMMLPALEILEKEFTARLNEEVIYPQKRYFEWAANSVNAIKFEEWLQHLGVDLGKHLVADTSVPTLGMDTITIKYPSKDDIIHFSGYDLGGQNIYDQIREVIAGLAKPDSFIVTVFDSSRFLSCENSIQQLLSSLKKFELKEYIPTIIGVFNKIDLQEYMMSEQWQNFTAEYLSNTLKELTLKELKYRVPNLLFKGQIREVILPTSDMIGFEHLEALIYDRIKQREPLFGKPPFTEVNAKAIAREIAAQLLVHQNPDPTYYEKLKKLLFEQRPLAVQYIEGIKLSGPATKELGEKESLRKLRKKFEGFELQLTKDTISTATLKEILVNCTSTQDIEAALKDRGYPTFQTNALDGTGIQELFAFMIEKKKEMIPLVKKQRQQVKRRKLSRI